MIIHICRWKSLGEIGGCTKQSKKTNVELFREYGYISKKRYLCEIHINKYIGLLKRNGVSYILLEKIPSKRVCCSLILCKKCMGNLDEVLDF